MTRAVSVEKKLAIAEAKAEMWQEKANRLSVELVETRQTIENVEREIVDVRAYNRAQLERSEEVAKQWKGEFDKAKDENNGLRSIIRDLELTVERHRGYQDGRIDAEPPRMVPEVKETRRAGWPYPASEVFDPVGVIGSTNPRTQYGSQKPWWHR